MDRNTDISMYLLLILYELEHEYGSADIKAVGDLIKRIDESVKHEQPMSRIAALISVLRYEISSLKNATHLPTHRR